MGCPSEAIAASPTTSERLGWGCMVIPISSVVPSTTFANTPSVMRSVTFGPMACIPRMRSVSSSATTLKNPLASPSISAVRLADGPECELRLPDFVTFLLRLRLGEPERGHLGSTEGDARDEVPVLGHRVLAGHVLDGDDAFVSGLVGEPETPDYVACRVDAVLGRPSVPVHLDDAALIDLDAGRVEVEVLDNGLPSDGHEQRLGLQGVATSFAGLAGGRIFATIPATLAFRLLLLL